MKINNVNEIDINHEKITVLRKNYVLLGRDIELILRKFIYEPLLSRQFRGKATSDGKVMLVSRKHKVNSIIDIVYDEINIILKETKS